MTFAATNLRCESDSDLNPRDAGVSTDSGDIEDAGDLVDSGTSPDGGADVEDVGGIQVGPLTITGTATADADVFAETGRQSYAGQADATGRYTVQITNAREDVVVTIRSVGSAARGEQAVELATSLDTMERLLQQSGDDDVLDETEYPATTLSPFTTARYALITEANGGEHPRSRDDLLTAELRANETAGPAFFDLAVIVHRVMDDPTRIDSSTSLALILDTQDATDHLYELGGTLLREGGLESGRDELAASIAGKTRFSNVPQGPLIQGYVAQKNGVIARGRGPLLTFNEDGGGILQRWRQDRVVPSRIDVPMTWTSSVTGALVVNFANPPPQTFDFVSLYRVLTAVDDLAVEWAIIEGYPSTTKLFRVETQRIEYYYVPGGLAVDWVVEIPINRYFFNESFMLAGYGMVPDATGARYAARCDVAPSRRPRRGAIHGRPTEGQDVGDSGARSASLQDGTRQQRGGGRRCGRRRDF